MSGYDTLGPLASHAKINLTLRILDEQPDGYHHVHTILQPISLHDQCWFRRSPIPGCHVTMHHCPPMRNNLITQAAEHLLKPGDGVTIHVHKNIPIGQGLGGGSSNAALTLLAINKLFDYQYPLSRLNDIARKLGVDIAFFLYGHTAIGQQRGDILSRHICPRAYYLLCSLPILVSTPDVFAAYREGHRTPITRHNDLEAAACACHPILATLRDTLFAYGVPYMTGSGGTFFLRCTRKREARLIQKALPHAIGPYPLSSHLVSGQAYTRPRIETQWKKHIMSKKSHLTQDND